MAKINAQVGTFERSGSVDRPFSPFSVRAQAKIAACKTWAEKPAGLVALSMLGPKFFVSQVKP